MYFRCKYGYRGYGKKVGKITFGLVNFFEATSKKKVKQYVKRRSLGGYTFHYIKEVSKEESLSVWPFLPPLKLD